MGVPTETVYGLAANALDADACARIFRAKGRPSTDPLIVHLLSFAELDALCHPNDDAWALAKAFWPGPLTLVMPKKPVVPDVVTAGRDSVAIRVPAHPLFRRLLRATGLPLAAPSANPFGYVSPTTAEHVREGLGRQIGHILDGGGCAIGLESTVVDLRRAGHPRILRPGAVTREQIEGILKTRVVSPRKRPQGVAQLGPGMLARHYSPRTPVTLHEDIAADAPLDPAEAYVLRRKPAGKALPNLYWLDAQGSVPRAAQRLFALLRKLDASHYRRIHVERAIGGGLADAINDRLRRAAAR